MLRKSFEEYQSVGFYYRTNYPKAVVFYLESSEILELTGLDRPSGNYSIMKWLDMEAISQNGVGFSARVLEESLKNGALKINLENPGMDYKIPPLILLQGGGFVSTGSFKKGTLQITLGLH